MLACQTARRRRLKAVAKDHSGRTANRRTLSIAATVKLRAPRVQWSFGHGAVQHAAVDARRRSNRRLRVDASAAGRHDDFVLATHVSAVPKTATSDDRALRDNVRAEEPVRTFSPTSPAFREHNRLEQANAAVLAAGSNTGAWTTVVTAEQPRTTALKPPKPNDWQTRYELARDLQRELKRVGCYGGEISGVWTRGSKAAMSDFMDRVNASLPVDQPDYVLLSLVQNHRQIACGVECPSGQVIAEGGRCVPRAVVAQATKKSQRLQERRLAEARLAAERQRDRLASSNSSRTWSVIEDCSPPPSPKNCLGSKIAISRSHQSPQAGLPKHCLAGWLSAVPFAATRAVLRHCDTFVRLAEIADREFRS